MSNKKNFKVGSRKWLGLAAVALPTLLISIDTSVLYLALPHLSIALKANSSQQLWIMDIYGFMLAGFLITMGNIGDRIGYRRLLIWGSTIFGLVSAMAAFSTNPNILIATRAVMGIAGATLMPSTLALIRNMFTDQKQRGIAISVWISCMMVGMVAGPLVGGLMLEHFWWGSVFLLGLPVMIVIVLTGKILLPEYRHTSTKRLDIIGVFYSLAAILPLIYGLTEFSRNNFQLLSIIAAMLGLIFSTLLVYREYSNSDSLLDLALFKNPVFSTTLITMLLVAVIMGGVALFIAQYLQMVLELSPLHTGLWMIPQALAMILGSSLIPVLAKRHRPSHIITIGLAISTMGMLLITFMPNIGGLFFVVTGFVLSVMGVSPVLVLGTGIIIGSVSEQKAGVASSISETSNHLGVALGVAILGSIGSFVYYTTIDKHLPYYLSKESQQVVRESIVGAHYVASTLNVEKGTTLLTFAKMAYINGFRIISGVGALVFAFLFLFVALKYRNVNTKEA